MCENPRSREDQILPVFLINLQQSEGFSLNSPPPFTYHHNWLPRGPQRTFLALRESQSQNERIMVMAELSAPSWPLRSSF
jgi:hypothetical protein